VTTTSCGIGRQKLPRLSDSNSKLYFFAELLACKLHVIFQQSTQAVYHLKIIDRQIFIIGHMYRIALEQLCGFQDCFFHFEKNPNYYELIRCGRHHRYDVSKEMSFNALSHGT